MKALLCAGVWLFVVATNALAANVYVAPDGVDNASCGAISSPCLTPYYAVQKLTVAGSTMFIRHGEYIVDTDPLPNQNAKIVPRANNCTITSYPGETATLIGDCGSGPGVAPTCGLIGSYDGSNQRNYTTISDLVLKGVVVMVGTGITVKNNDISVGGDGWVGTEQGEVIWLSNCYDSLIQNNLIHSNDAQANLNNNGLIMEYNSARVVIEKNTFHSSKGPGITLKDKPGTHTVRYNYFYDNLGAGVWTANQEQSSGSLIYQNIFRNNALADEDESGGLTMCIEHPGLMVYNNVFYKNKRSNITKWTTDASLTFNLFNNISVADAGQNHQHYPYHSAATMPAMLYNDYNRYYGGGQWKYGPTVYSSLSTWQTKVQGFNATFEVNSALSDPGFLNDSGNFTLPTDFKRAAYPEDGRGGDWPSVVGAYITGNEQIGADLDFIDPEEPTPDPEPEPPAPTTSGPILRTGSHLLRVGDSVLRVQ